MDHRFAILIDGAFFMRKLRAELGRRRPEVEDVVQKIQAIRDDPRFRGYELLRVYYYDAVPASGRITHPVTGETVNLADTEVNRRNRAFHQKLELQPDIALRLGEAIIRPPGFKLTQRALRDRGIGTRGLRPDDFVFDIEQKGVDLRIGLDIARLSLNRLVRTLIVVTGDSDFIPAFKFARREGVRVVLYTMGHGVKGELKAHTDGIVETLSVPVPGQEAADENDAL